MQITLRGIDPELAEIIKRISEQEGTSLNKAALKLLAEGAGIRRATKDKKVIGSDLDHLFGTWAESDAKQFLESVRSCEQIDEDLWK